MDQFNEHHFINPTTLAMLRKNTANNPEFLTELYQCFIDDSQELITELNHTATQNNHDDYFAAVHTLKGLSGTIGCSRMFEILKVMDSLNKEKNFNHSVSYLPQLEMAFSDTSDAIREQILNTTT
jgi:HPt (histidine-containing phosphotransfer) domain-containing protein